MAQRASREDVIQQDVHDLHSLGYAQELFRSMGGFSNFAISFSIISILTGAVILYDYGLAWAGTAASLHRLAAGHHLRPLHRRLDGRGRLCLPDGRRPVLLGQQDEEQGLGLVDRLAQPDRPVRDRGRHQLRRGAVRQRHDHHAADGRRLLQHHGLLRRPGVRRRRPCTQRRAGDHGASCLPSSWP